MIVGHPFKGGMPYSTGYLQHPDMKRFSLNDSTLFVPPNPLVWASALAVAGNASQNQSFGDFFYSYFGGRSYSSNPKANTMLEGMKRCWENHASKDPQAACQYYIQGFERLAYSS